MRRLIVILLVALGAVESSAQQFPADLWHVGELRLNDNRYVKGKIKYHLDHEAVQLERNGKIETYSSQQVASFKLIDTSKKAYRHFFTLPYSENGTRPRPTFFEVIVEGKSTLLAREYVAIISNGINNFDRRRFNNRIGANNFNNPANTVRQVLSYKMYIVNLDGKIRELSKRRKDLLSILKGHDDEMKKFIKEYGLKFTNVQDMARIVGHYNSISTEQSKLD